MYTFFYPVSDEALEKPLQVVFHTWNIMGPDRNLFLFQVVIHFTDGADEQIERLEAASSALHSGGNFFFFFLFQALIIVHINMYGTVLP